MPKAVQSTNAVLQQSISQIHTVAGYSYDEVNFPLLNEVANKYKSFEVPQKNGTTRNISIPVTWSKDSRNYMLSPISFRPVLELMNLLSLQAYFRWNKVSSSLLHGGEYPMQFERVFLNKVLE